jgi:hypothetical protein
MDIQIIEDFISPKNQKVFFDFVSSNAFPYRFQNVHNETSSVAPKRYYRDHRGHYQVDVANGELHGELHTEFRDESYNSTIYATPQQLTHHLYMRENEDEQKSPQYPILTPFLESIYSVVGGYSLLRAKVNVTMPDPRFDPYTSQVPHTDLKYDNGTDLPHIVFLYYINDSDGPTYFYDESLNMIDYVNPAMGTCIMFDGGILHAGSNPNITPFRYVLNINIELP